MPHRDISAIAAAARTINHVITLEETLQAVVNAARNSVPGFDHVGISTLDKRGTIETRATTGDLVECLDRLQYDLEEGPCVDAKRTPDVHVVRVPHISR